jgi:hypothetical protein
MPTEDIVLAKDGSFYIMEKQREMTGRQVIKLDLFTPNSGGATYPTHSVPSGSTKKPDA